MQLLLRGHRHPMKVKEPSLMGRLWSHHRGQEEVEPFETAIYLRPVGLSHLPPLILLLELSVELTGLEFRPGTVGTP